LCGGRSFRHWWRVEGYDIGRCKDCGLVQVLQEVTVAQLQELYSSGYYNGDNDKVYRNYLADPAAKIAHFGRRFDRVCRENNLTKPGRLLEIGCAFGLGLVAARERGWTVCGAELSAHAAAWAREHYGLDVRSEPDALQHMPDASQDVVTMWDVMEHLQEPREMLREIRRILAPGGVLYFATCDVGSLGARLYGRHWYLIAPPYHLIYFDHESTRQMLEREGFMVRRICNDGRPSAGELGPA
jgi:SAM-dependent methyltransferase